MSFEMIIQINIMYRSRVISYIFIKFDIKMSMLLYFFTILEMYIDKKIVNLQKYNLYRNNFMNSHN